MKSYKTISKYIENFPKDVQKTLRQIRSTLKKAVPKSSEAIKYGIPTIVGSKNIVHFAAYKKHIGFYPGSSAIKIFQKELAKYKISKGTVRFPLDKPLPLGLIAKITKFRAKEDRLGE